MNKTLGKTNIKVSPIGLGCMNLSHAYGSAIPEKDAINFIQKSYNMGYTFFDTAEVYSGETTTGEKSNNEEILGKALSDIREDVVIATKFGVKHKGKYLEMDSKKETIRKSIEGSLKRLKTDYIDIYYQHRIDPKVEPETVASVMQDLKDEDKIKAWGISEANPEYLKRANEIFSVTAIENRYSMLARHHESLFSLCEKLNISFIAFSPIANGFLSGIFNKNSTFEDKDFRNDMPQYTVEGFEAAKELFNLLNKYCEDKNATMSQISLAWMMCKKDYIIPIPGTTKIENMISNFEASNIILNKKEIKEIDILLDKLDIPVFGGH